MDLMAVGEGGRVMALSALDERIFLQEILALKSCGQVRKVLIRRRALPEHFVGHLALLWVGCLTR